MAPRVGSADGIGCMYVYCRELIRARGRQWFNLVMLAKGCLLRNEVSLA